MQLTFVDTESNYPSALSTPIDKVMVKHVSKQLMPDPSYGHATSSLVFRPMSSAQWLPNTLSDGTVKDKLIVAHNVFLTVGI